IVPSLTKSPAASSSPSGSSASARTGPSRPGPNGCHAVPSQRAMRESCVLPENRNSPPAITSPLLRTSTASTGPSRPWPNVAHRAPLRAVPAGDVGSVAVVAVAADHRLVVGDRDRLDLADRRAEAEPRAAGPGEHLGSAVGGTGSRHPHLAELVERRGRSGDA